MIRFLSIVFFILVGCSDNPVGIQEVQTYPFELNTGFQSGHISKRKNGEWKKVFSEEEIHEIIERIDPIAIKLGYNSEKH